ncbi:hypothetical protein A8A01_01285 [Ewingella americana]|nr:hypothetical protein A8A01_01285 [Ewingella americana]
MNITAGYHPTNRKIDTGKALEWWPVFIDHFKEPKWHINVGVYGFILLFLKQKRGETAVL